MLGALFRSATQLEILRLLFSGEKKSYYLRELERESSVKKTALEKELKKLLDGGLVTAHRDGNRVYYTANAENPIYPELVAIVEKTLGMRAVLTQKLADERIELAILFGSFAKGNEQDASDIDLIIVGTIGLRAWTKLMSGVQEKLGREINPHIYTHDEFVDKIDRDDAFLAPVLAGKIEVLKGDIRAYSKIA